MHGCPSRVTKSSTMAAAEMTEAHASNKIQIDRRWFQFLNLNLKPRKALPRKTDTLQDQVV